ncbi:ABC-2 transporter permease [Cytobacillus massiliigabonensis]|uniref:ABC-2 transporter permease n=1 Tax=Cytobacillus massiliigabonensis TaxID=1871011 RepID=UPI000C851F6F
MFNLIIKDFYIQKYLLLLYFGLIFFYFFTDLHISFVIIIVSCMFVINSHYYDERGKTNILLNSLPYSRKQIISSKYIGTLIFTTFVTILVITLNIILQVVTKTPTEILSIKNILISYLLIMTFTSFYLPFFYKFSQQYLLIAFSVLFVIIMVFANKISALFAENLDGIYNFLLSLSIINLYSLFTFIVVVCYFISWLISIKVYENKEF